MRVSFFEYLFCFIRAIRFIHAIRLNPVPLFLVPSSSYQGKLTSWGRLVTFAILSPLYRTHWHWAPGEIYFGFQRAHIHQADKEKRRRESCAGAHQQARSRGPAAAHHLLGQRQEAMFGDGLHLRYFIAWREDHGPSLH